MIFKQSVSQLAIASFVISGLLASGLAQAHPRWILPSHFNVSKSDGEWITFDVTASHGTFVMDKPASAESASIILPTGQVLRPDHVSRGKRRSVFDFHFVETGTHKVTVNSEPVYYTRYKAGKRDTEKWLRADKVSRLQLLPSNARDISTTLSVSRVETYITVGKPSTEAFKLEGKYLELKPITHPADIVAGSPVTFQLYYQGQPKSGVKAEITRDGTLYRNSQEQIEVTSDEQGKVTFTPVNAGRYIFKARHEGPLEGNPLADESGATLHLTFEAVLP
ncbi:DUF4198 domain-containing protein [Motilimonas cestriensis]|uniref:DUF4198 domain-containing protein n=1 Tax=Motilimonas cestriensis TaxID=2742685 RepID=A0ABS8W3W4_9GAMM|nr:DUF4198 domain-containing protein [Motilimonas cestriensis]MCE2593218.1 DUF4198 domain-containing protein [Motilimonas cestriensis]